MDSDSPHDADTEQPSRRGSHATKTARLIFGLACLTSFLTYIHRYSWGVARPYLKQEADLSSEAMGWLDAGFSLTYAFGQFPGGWAGDLYGPRLLIPIAALLWSVVMLGPILFNGFWRLMVVRLLFGATQAPAYPNLGKITQNWFPSSIRTTVQGCVASFSGRAGAAVAPPLIGVLLMTGLGIWLASLAGCAVRGGSILCSPLLALVSQRPG